ncbi:Peroxiredoxin-2E-1 [Durusdinium trenchii]|uniref:Chloroplastic (Glutaredoxin-dependent peroxiredoxin) (Peroxiredoxin IIE-1) (Thioredoxin peroxidase 2E-1) n=1 Tax=Durusdinium trenchii TaxID=1381693 RepID=A0ABP0JQK8_9DINO
MATRPVSALLRNSAWPPDTGPPTAHTIAMESTQQSRWRHGAKALRENPVSRSLSRAIALVRDGLAPQPKRTANVRSSPSGGSSRGGAFAPAKSDPSYGYALRRRQNSKGLWRQRYRAKVDQRWIQEYDEAFAYNSAISACERSHCQSDSIEQIINKLKLCSVAVSALQPGTVGSTGDILERIVLTSRATAIGACEKGGEWLLALQILEQMTHESIEGNTVTVTVTYCAAMSVAQDCSFANISFKRLEIAANHERGTGDLDVILANSAVEVTYTAAISSCEPSAKWDVALALFMEMTQEIPQKSSETGMQAGLCPENPTVMEVSSEGRRRMDRERLDAPAHHEPYEYFDAVTGATLRKEAVLAARQVEMDQPVYAKVPFDECYPTTGRFQVRASQNARALLLEALKALFVRYDFHDGQRMQCRFSVGSPRAVNFPRLMEYKLERQTLRAKIIVKQLKLEGTKTGLHGKTPVLSQGKEFEWEYVADLYTKLLSAETCRRRRHTVPGYLAKQAELKAKGVSDVIVYCVNDCAVMDAWAKDLKVDGSIVSCYGDSGSLLTKACGLELKHPGVLQVLGNPRCKRSTMIVEDMVVKEIFVAESENDPSGDAAPESTFVDNILAHL